MIPYHKRIDIIWAAQVDQGELVALLAVNEFLGADGFCWPGINELAKMSRCSRSTFKRIMNRLIEKSVLTRKPRFKNGSATSNSYFIDFEALQSLPSVQNEPTPRLKMNLPSVQNEPTSVHSCEPTPQFIAVNLPPVHSCEPRITHLNDQIRTTHQDPERGYARGVCAAQAEIVLEQPTATEQNSRLTAEQPEFIPRQNLNQEISTIPRRIPGENDRQATPTITRDDLLTQQKRAALQGRLTAEERSAYVDQAIETYNQYRGAWGKCPGLTNSARNNLERILTAPGRSPDEFISLVRDATFWAAKSQWLNRPEFESKHFGYLIGRSGNQDRLVDYALQWRSLPDSSKVGAVLKIAQKKDEIQYHDLEGNPTKQTWAKAIWWDISKDAIAGKPISELQKKWAEFYFPKYDIYKGDEWLA